MSGGSMNYIYSRLEIDARFPCDTPERQAFFQHLQKVIRALHDIEWVDSGDSLPGTENSSIRNCLHTTDVLKSCVDEANQLINKLREEIDFLKSRGLIVDKGKC